MVDVFVIGAGPAGLFLGSALAARGVDVRIADPSATWDHTYGLWADEVGDLPIAAAWPRTEVVLPTRTVDLGRGYALLDNVATRDRLTAELDVATRSAIAVHHESDHSVVVDASNAGVFLARDGAPTLYQTAWGRSLREARHPYATDAMRLMDFRGGTGTFLYAMPQGTDLFVEETRLVGAQASVQGLEAHLDTRLATDGVDGHVTATERVVIPMDTPLPTIGQRTIGFGAAAGFVHPATGYSLGRTLRAAPIVADAVAYGLSASHAPASIARDAWHAMWPAPLRRAHELHLTGARILASLTPDQTARFFDAFFALPKARWAPYLSGDAPAATVAATMAELFARADNTTRSLLVRRALGPATWSLFRSPSAAGSIR